MTPEESLANWVQRFTSKFQNVDYTPVLRQIRMIIKNSIDDNFQQGGRYGNDNIWGGGNQQWKVSRRANKDKGYQGKSSSGKTLIDTSALAKSIYVKVIQEGNKISIEIGSNLPYARIHQFGGKIKLSAREGSAKWKVSGSKKTGYKYKFAKKKAALSSRTIERKFKVGEVTINIPARPFLVIQNEDIEKIVQALKVFYIQHLNK